ncbi:DUF4276 family protein [candidate division WOR-3 bacterium]|nr:DUF4276 family protein [candidate division WOR-3 bacterium]
MHIEFLVEEPSAEEVLKRIIPRLFYKEIIYRILTHQGKKDLLSKLPCRLKGYSRWIPKNYRIVILVDRDNENCHTLKSALEQAALISGLTTKSSVQTHEPFQILNRLAIEEIEAWFFGDVQALNSAFPRVPETLGRKAKYRNPDAISGGTKEALEKVFQSYGYYKTGMPRIEVAKKVSSFMNPSINKSKSFQTFKDGIEKLQLRN